jgi:hypothetical protein
MRKRISTILSIWPVRASVAALAGNRKISLGRARGTECVGVALPCSHRSLSVRSLADQGIKSKEQGVSLRDQEAVFDLANTCG